MLIEYDENAKSYLVTECHDANIIRFNNELLKITSPEEELAEDENFVYYFIEEYQNKWNRWMALGDGWTYHLENHKDDHETTASGECWQRTHRHGTFNKDYAINLCKDLKNMLIDAKVYDKYPSQYVKDHIEKCQITDFRVCQAHYIYRKKVII